MRSSSGMGAASSTFPVWFIAFVLLSLQVYVAEGRNGSSNPCVDGTYNHSGRKCCLCNTGQYLKEHCATDLQYGKCERCPLKTYSSQPNNLESCEPCTSCSQPNANLEVKASCTSGVDAKCQCKKDHYCSSGTETCTFCNPCEECPEGIKVACSANSNTVCNVKIEGVNTGVIIISVLGSLIGLIVIALIAYCVRKRYGKSDTTSGQPTNAADLEMQQPLSAPVVDLLPHRPDIARAIGWKDMQDIAMRSSISKKDIESCQLDHQNDSQEQTLQLLSIWIEQQGSEASKNLIQILETLRKRATAQDVLEILSRSQLPA